MKDLKGKVALVTGGGQGLGFAICSTLAEAGLTVIAADINEQNAMKTSEKIGGTSEGIKLDVGNEEEVKSTLDAIIDRHGRLDVLINNAGIDVTKSVEEMTVEEFDRVVRVNLHGPFVLSKYTLPLMKDKGGHIINITSTAAKRVWANASAYHASKWGLLALSYALFVEARQYNIKVTAVVAGGMKTPFILERFPDVDTSKLQDPKNVAETIKFVLSQPDESIIPEVMVLPLHETSWP